MQANEWPQTLKNYFFVTHVRDWVNQADAVERKSYVVAITCRHV